MTWTLLGISFCYLVFVGPIYICTLFSINYQPNLICFILYWLQYTTNFVVYAGRSEQYRRAYLQYIKTTLPWLFTEKSDRKENILTAGKIKFYIKCKIKNIKFYIRCYQYVNDVKEKQGGNIHHQSLLEKIKQFSASATEL